MNEKRFNISFLAFIYLMIKSNKQQQIIKHMNYERNKRRKKHLRKKTEYFFWLWTSVASLSTYIFSFEFFHFGFFNPFSIWNPSRHYTSCILILQMCSAKNSTIFKRNFESNKFSVIRKRNFRPFVKFSVRALCELLK